MFLRLVVEYGRRSNWRGHQTSPTVVSLKGRLPQKLQSKSTISFEIIQINSLFRHGFMKKPKSKFIEIENRRILCLSDGFRKTNLGIDLIANAFRGRYKTQNYFQNFLHLFSVPSFIFWKNKSGLILAYPQRIV